MGLGHDAFPLPKLNVRHAIRQTIFDGGDLQLDRCAESITGRLDDRNFARMRTGEYS